MIIKNKFKWLIDDQLLRLWCITYFKKLLRTFFTIPLAKLNKKFLICFYNV